MDQLAGLRVALQGRYVLGLEIGAGAMATVYLAHDVRHDRSVALKVLRAELSHSLDGERFLREIRVIARLSHPHILPLFDSGVAGESLFYVMPHVEGHSLREWMRRAGALPVSEALRVTREVGLALDYAHRQGVIHRDVKPENILLLDGHATIGDFGIAMALGVAESDRMTQTGASVGTAAYMSPEQAAGDAVDGRSDVYSLGCVLHEMLAGEPPFTGPTLQAVIAKRFVQPPPDLTALRDGVPRQVARAVQRALARSVADRFETAARFVEALDERSETADPGAPEKSVAILPFANLSPDPENEYFADGVAEEVLNVLAQAEDLRVAGRTSSFSFRARTQDLRSIGRQLNVRTVLEGSVRRAGNRVRISAQLVDVDDGFHLWSERYDREIEDVFQVQDEIATSIARRLQVSLREGRRAVRDQRTANSIEAYDSYLRGRALLYKHVSSVVEAQRCMQRAVALDPTFAPAWAGVAEVCTFASFNCALPPEVIGAAMREASGHAIRLGPDLAESQSAAGMVKLLCDWDWQGAERHLLRAIELNPSEVQPGAWYGFIHLGLVNGRFEEGADWLRRMHETDPISANTMVLFALTLGHCPGRSGEAVGWARRALEIEPESLVTKQGLQLSLLLDRQHDASIAAARRALDAEGRLPIVLAPLAIALAETGEESAARDIADELTERSLHEYVSPSIRALVSAAIGEPEAAILLAREGFARKDPALVLGPFGAAWGHALRALPQFRELMAGAGIPDRNRA